MSIEYKEIYNANYPASQLEFQAAILDGWRIDENNLPHAGMFVFDIKLVRDTEIEYVNVQRIEEAEHVKMAVKRVGRQAKV